MALVLADGQRTLGIGDLFLGNSTIGVEQPEGLAQFLEGDIAAHRE